MAELQISKYSDLSCMYVSHELLFIADSDRIFVDSDVLLEGLPLVDFDAESDPEALSFDNDNAISDLATEEILVEGLAEGAGKIKT